jgi:hypothetical protein
LFDLQGQTLSPALPSSGEIVMKYNRLWPFTTLLVQIIAILIALYSLNTIAVGMVGLGLPTPSCPKGIDNIYMPDDQKRQCFDERMRLYVPRWAMLVARVAVVVSFLIPLIGAAVWLSHHLSGARFSGKNEVTVQLILVTVTILVLMLTYPWDLRLLVEFVISGNV